MNKFWTGVGVLLAVAVIAFQGDFPIETTEADLDYRYKQTNDQVTLNIISTDSTETNNFVNDCLKSVVYKAHTKPLQPGDYHVKVQHNDKTVVEQIIEVER